MNTRTHIKRRGNRPYSSEQKETLLANLIAMVVTDGTSLEMASRILGVARTTAEHWVKKWKRAHGTDIRANRKKETPAAGAFQGAAQRLAAAEEAVRNGGCIEDMARKHHVDKQDLLAELKKRPLRGPEDPNKIWHYGGRGPKNASVTTCIV